MEHYIDINMNHRERCAGCIKRNKNIQSPKAKYDTITLKKEKSKTQVKLTF